MPQTFGDLAAVCEGATYPAAPPYAGPGPHPIVLVAHPERPELSVPLSEAVSEVQLVACAHRLDSFIENCSYFNGRRGANQDLVSGDVQLLIVEVRTGNRVDRTVAPGQPSPSCAPEISGSGTSGQTQYGPVDWQAINAVLDRYRSQPAAG